MLEVIGIVGSILLNFAILPQIFRVIKLKDSQEISLTSIFMALIGIIIMYFKAYSEHSKFFMLNYTLCGVLEVIFLFVTLKYRR